MPLGTSAPTGPVMGRVGPSAKRSAWVGSFTRSAAAPGTAVDRYAYVWQISFYQPGWGATSLEFTDQEVPKPLSQMPVTTTVPSDPVGQRFPLELIVYLKP